MGEDNKEGRYRWLTMDEIMGVFYEEYLKTKYEKQYEESRMNKYTKTSNCYPPRGEWVLIPNYIGPQLGYAKMSLAMYMGGDDWRDGRNDKIASPTHWTFMLDIPARTIDEVGRWISVGEGVPPHGEYVLASCVSMIGSEAPFYRLLKLEEVAWGNQQCKSERWLSKDGASFHLTDVRYWFRPPEAP